MKAAFAFNKRLSPINSIQGAEVVRHPPAQYMALCLFNNTYWEFDKARNYAPVLVFDGSVERLDAINTKFPNGLDTVYFSKDKPNVQYRYEFNERQLAELAGKGFWSEDGVNIPGLFTAAKFQLEADVIVEEIVNDKENRKEPIFNIEILNAYSNTFDAKAYDLASKITRHKPEESKTIETNVQAEVEQNIAAELSAAAKSAMLSKPDVAAQTTYRPMTKEQLDVHNKSANVAAAVNATRDDIKHARDAGNARAEAEREAERTRSEVEQSKLDAMGVTITNNIAPKTPSVSTANNRIFNDAPAAETDVSVPDSVAAFMKELSAGSAKASTIVSADKKDDKRDSGSGTATSTDGLGTYTFEDRSTAQYEMRQDEGKGNEKPADDEKQTDKDDDKTEKADANDMSAVGSKHRQAQLNQITNTQVPQMAVKEDDRSK